MACAELTERATALFTSSPVRRSPVVLMLDSMEAGMYWRMVRSLLELADEVSANSNFYNQCGNTSLGKEVRTVQLFS